MRKRNLVKYLWILLVALTLLLPAEAFAAAQAEYGRQITAGQICTTEAEAAEVMRAYLVKRQEMFSIPVRLKIERTSGSGDRAEDLDKAMDRIFDLAFMETDKPYEGDYMNQVKGFSKDPKGSWNGDYFEGTLEFILPLMSTAAMENEVDAAVAKILKELALDGKSEYEKIRAIYDYICSHTTYEDLADSDTPYTAYSILVLGKGTCEGYSRAVYRLMREAGIGCRYIGAAAKKGGAGHAWNIVRIGKLWYYVDTTWDTTNFQTNRPYQYFLKGSKDRSYVDHEDFVVSINKSEPDFWKLHPLSASDYPYVDPAPSPAPPVFKKAEIRDVSNSEKGAVIRWKKTPGAAGYVVYCGRQGEGIREVAEIMNPDTLQCVDTKIRTNCWGRVYHYYVCALYKNGTEGGLLIEGPKSDMLALIRLAPMKVTELKNVADNKNASGRHEKAAAGSVKCSFKCTAANAAEGYEIQYAASKEDLTSRNGSYRTVTIKGRKNQSVVIRGLDKGKTWFFRVRSYASYTNSSSGKKTICWSPYGNIKSIKVKAPTPSGKMVYQVTESVRNNTKGIYVYWKTSPNVDGYLVFRKDGRNGAWNEIARVNGSEERSYLDSSVKEENGKIYYYTVCGVQGKRKSPYNKEGKMIVRLRTPGIKAESKKAGTVVLTWSRNGAAGGYEIQYSTNKDFKNCQKKMIGKSTTGTTEIRGLKSGKTWYFRIRSFKGTGTSQSFSGWSAVRALG